MSSPLLVNDPVKQFWADFLAEQPHPSPYLHQQYLAEPFGDNPVLANELGQLVAAGAKTATCSALWEWQEEGQPIPQPGLITIVLDGAGFPLCIIETVRVDVCSFDKVEAGFAYAEGEGDLSLKYWRTAHKNFFNRVLPKIGRQFSQDMPLVCESFRLIYP